LITYNSATELKIDKILKYRIKNIKNKSGKILKNQEKYVQIREKYCKLQERHLNNINCI